jgi:hypothetical protein
MSFKRSITFALAALIAVSALAAGEAPTLTLVEPVKDFGTVPKGEKLDWTFQIKNTGTADLQILAVRPTCGCTVAEYDKTIKPGEIGKVVAHVDTSNLAGPVAKAVTIESNDASTPAAQVVIRAVVKPYVEAFPAGFIRYNVVQGDTQVQTVTLYTEESEPFEIIRTETPGDWVKVEYKKAEGSEVVAAGRPNATQYRLAVTYGGPTAKVGPLAEKVKIVTNSKHQPEYLLTLSGVVRPSYSVVPTVLNFGDSAPPTERSVTLRSNDTKAPAAFKVTKVESSVPGVTAEARATENPGEYQVVVTLAKDAKDGAIDGNLKIYTSDTTTPVFTLPVRGTVKSGTAGTGSSK